VSKKTGKSIKSRKQKKNNRKNQTVKKNRLNRLKFLKNRPVRFCFGFISLKLKKPNRIQTEKTEPNRKKTSQTEKPSKAGFCPKKPNRTETGRFEPVLVFFLNFGLVIVFDKNRTELKIITPNSK